MRGNGVERFLLTFAIVIGLGISITFIELALNNYFDEEMQARPRNQEHTIIMKNEDTEYMIGNEWYNVGDVVDRNLLDPQQMDTYFTQQEITEGDEIYNRIYGKSFPTTGEVDLADLRYLKMLYVDYNGDVRCGEMIVNVEIADTVLDNFYSLYRDAYPIERMELIDNYWDTDGNTTDRKSILANNTSAFCYRTIAGTHEMSKHAYGLAVDINPHDNPYVWRNEDGSFKLETLDDHEREMLEDRNKPHAINMHDEAYTTFCYSGFEWGGEWENPLDYQHFEWAPQE